MAKKSYVFFSLEFNVWTEWRDIEREKQRKKQIKEERKMVVGAEERGRERVEEQKEEDVMRALREV